MRRPVLRWLLASGILLRDTSVVAEHSRANVPFRIPNFLSRRTRKVPGGLPSLHASDPEDNALRTNNPVHLPHSRPFVVPKWLRLPSRASLVNFANSELGEALISGLQAGIIVIFAVEIFRAFRDVRRELMDETNGGYIAGNTVLTPAAAESLISWLQSSTEEQQKKYPRSVPPLMVGLAQDLMTNCHKLSDRDKFDILSSLSKQEAQLLQSCMLKPTCETRFKRLQGFDYVINDISRWLRQSGANTISPYSGILQQGRQGMALWGPPGCGKSTILKTIAAESGLPTLVITPSLLQRKYYGESTNQVRTLFGLIAKLGPCIVVLDELDGMFRTRNSDDHEAGREMKTEFLQWWDGVTSDSRNDSGVLIVGATNRPFDVDPAVWRRLPERFYIGAADWKGRRDICNEWISTYRIPVQHREMLLKYLADHTHGYTNSDLLHVFQTACQIGPLSRDHSDPSNLELTAEDIREAINSVAPTRFTSQYMSQLRGFLSPQDLRRSQPGGVQSPETTEEDSHVWRTPIGNFYQINIPVESKVFEDFEKLWTIHQQLEDLSDSEDSFSDSEDSDEMDLE